MLLGKETVVSQWFGDGRWVPVPSLAVLDGDTTPWPMVLLFVWAAVALTWVTAWLMTRKIRHRRDELTLSLANQSRRLADKSEELSAVCEILNCSLNKPEQAAEFALQRMIRLIPNLSRGGLLVRGPKDRRFRIIAHTGYRDFVFSRLDFTFEEIISQYAEGTEELADGVFLVRCPNLEGTDLPRATFMVALVLEFRGLLRGLLVFDHEIDIGVVGELELERLKRFRIYAGDVLARLRIDQEERRRSLA
ncbi:hypothetical protein [Acanthopleuribacter pedis]|uniref:Uncharacterized protein n=1 Tax=Acanthopleuribacter pedis TaxID=442870 RepID=A0A8J7QKE2_9BACT|nr:hypothetical protein [Acanthopleuribacter pedis]MBO1319823.1 hypothetical protein [Acanthopleuribacter pedis]